VQQQGDAGGEVRLYADSDAAQGQVQEALAAAGLPAAPQGHASMLKVVITEGETGRLLDTDEVPFELVATSGAR
jgi:hypothetical protein